MGGKGKKLQRRDEIVDSGVDTTMYKGLYLLQKRRSIKHNGNIMMTYGIMMACYPAHGPRRKEWGIWGISGATRGVSGYTGCKWIHSYATTGLPVL